MTIDSHLTVEEMSKLSDKVKRWYYAPKSITTIKALRGNVEGVTLEVSHSNYKQGWVTTDSYSMSTQVNDTDLEEHRYSIEIRDMEPKKKYTEGKEIIKTTFEKAWKNYQRNEKKFEKRDIAHARSLVTQ